MFWRRVNSTKKRSAFVWNIRRWWGGVKNTVLPTKVVNYGRKKGRTVYDTMILSWQARELTQTPFETIQQDNIIPFNMAIARKAHDWVLNNIKWKSDQVVYGRRDYWATSVEVLGRKEDDCDGMACAVWRKMRDACFSDNKIGMVALVGNGQGHMVAMYQISEDDFYVLDNGYLTTEIMLASELFSDSVKCKGMKPVAGFNLWELWAVG